jgi:hypothetical protein
VLAEIKADLTLKRIPVIIFPSSLSPSDVDDSYEQCANCYVPKPAQLDDYYDAVSIVERFWCECALLPSKS